MQKLLRIFLEKNSHAAPGPVSTGRTWSEGRGEVVEEVFLPLLVLSKDLFLLGGNIAPAMIAAWGGEFTSLFPSSAPSWRFWAAIPPPGSPGQPPPWPLLILHLPGWEGRKNVAVSQLAPFRRIWVDGCAGCDFGRLRARPRAPDPAQGVTGARHTHDDIPGDVGARMEPRALHRCSKRPTTNIEGSMMVRGARR